MNPRQRMYSKVQTKSETSGAENILSDISEVDIKNSVVGYEISRFEIENGLTDRLIYDLRAEAENPLIQAGPGQIVFWVTGYDETPLELFEIPDFREFVRKADKSSPCWIYFADPASLWPQIVAFCTADNARAVTRKGQSRNPLSLSSPDVESFLKRQHDAYWALCSWANVPEEEADKKLKEIFRSFGIKIESP